MSKVILQSLLLYSNSNYLYNLYIKTRLLYMQGVSVPHVKNLLGKNREPKTKNCSRRANFHQQRCQL